MSNPARAAVLAEDSRHQQFARFYLKRRGIHDIRFLPLPSGRGSGEQFVRKNYAKEVQDHRLRAARAKKSFVVLIDADNNSVAQRHKHLADELAMAALDARTDIERIAHLIPKRHIETWILCLNGEAVDEETSYRARTIDPTEVASAAETLFTWSRRNADIPLHRIPSLASAIPEVQRLD